MKVSTSGSANVTQATHMRVCQRDDGTCSYEQTLADVYFDVDGFVKLDNGFGSAPVYAKKWKVDTWTTLRLYFDWTQDALKVALLMRPSTGVDDYDDDDDTFTEVAVITAPGCSTCQYFKALCMYNTNPSTVSFFDAFRFYDVANMTVDATIGGALPNASNVKIVYTQGDLTTEPAEPAKDACNQNSSYYRSLDGGDALMTSSGGTSVVRAQSMQLTILNNSRFKAYACAWSNNSFAPTTMPSSLPTMPTQVPTAMPTQPPTNQTASVRRALASTPGYIAYTSTTSSIAYGVASKPPVFAAAPSTNFVVTSGSEYEAYDSYDVNVFGPRTVSKYGVEQPWVKYVSVVGNEAPGDPVSCFGSSNGVCDVAKCYGPKRDACNHGLRLLPEASPAPTPMPTPYSSTGFVSTHAPSPRPTPSSRPSPLPSVASDSGVEDAEEENDDLSFLRKFCFRRNQYLLALSIEPGKLPSRVTTSARYTIKLSSPELKTIRNSFWLLPQRTMKAMDLNVDYVDIRILSRSAGSFLVWSIGDDTQDDWSIGDGTQSGGSGDESWQLTCALPRKYDAISWPERGIIESTFNMDNNSKYWDSDGSCETEYSSEPTVATIRLDVDTAHSLHVLACRDGNEPSSSSEEFVFILSSLEVYAAALTCIAFVAFVVWYSCRVLTPLLQIRAGVCAIVEKTQCSEVLYKAPCICIVTRDTDEAKKTKLCGPFPLPKLCWNDKDGSAQGICARTSVKEIDERSCNNCIAGGSLFGSCVTCSSSSAGSGNEDGPPVDDDEVEMATFRRLYRNRRLYKPVPGTDHDEDRQQTRPADIAPAGAASQETNSGDTEEETNSGAFEERKSDGQNSGDDEERKNNDSGDVEIGTSSLLRRHRDGTQEADI